MSSSSSESSDRRSGLSSDSESSDSGGGGSKPGFLFGNVDNKLRAKAKYLDKVQATVLLKRVSICRLSKCELQLCACFTRRASAASPASCEVISLA